MNTNLVNIVKQIIAANGETVLSDPQRLKAFFSDLAKDEPKPLRTAFGRCIEEGAYNALKLEPDRNERAERKAVIAQRVHDEHGLDIALCSEALDILEAALFADKKEPARCVQCGRELQEGWVSCPYCGAAQTAPPQQPQYVPPPKPPIQQPQYTPPKPVETSSYIPPQSGITLMTTNAIPEEKKKHPVVFLIVLATAVGLIWYFSQQSYSENTASSPANMVNTFFNQGVSHYNEKEYDQAITAFNKTLELEPKYAPALAYRGGSYRYKENYNVAIADCNAALEIDRNNAIAWFHRGSAYYLKGDNSRGIEDLTEAIRLNSTNADAYNNRGGAYRNKGDYNRAIADYTEGLKLAPNDDVIKNNLADARNRQARAAAPPPVRQTSNMVRINGGTFTMGSPASEPERVDDEVQHRVTVSSFYMGKYEVTQREWREVMGNNPSDFKGDDLPVEQVSWYDVVEYCNKRSEKEGLTPVYAINKSRNDPNNTAPTTGGYEWENDTIRWLVTWNRNANGYRLPTEAEWEYACRAGTATPFSTGNNITTGQANYDGNNPYNGNTKGTYRKRTTLAGSFAPNAWGLYDMYGNVWEWCWDWYGAYARGAQTNPLGAGSGSDRVVRGGSWFNVARHLRSAIRSSFTPARRDDCVGFRLARSEF
jgi:formylglycine-generating enzyme required for sulfatase activity